MRNAILFALALTVLAAQTIEVRGFAPLDGDWKFSPGDDPRFAAPDFDDSAWRTVRVPGGVLPRSTGISWLRFHVKLPDVGEPPTLLLPSLGSSYEVFAWGQNDDITVVTVRRKP